MRPVRLELNGFASFRDRTVVDFTNADYFALVGPTGSGKSTILDAITFALYGTAYRWRRDNAVADALAPSTNRCTVALVFDAGPHRYQVAREVRRTSQNIQQNNVSLVRFADPLAVEIDPAGPQPEVLAGEIKELKAAISELLGLDFPDFCQCVVLPQGQFAKFLSATPSERQKILLKLLGAEHYEDIGRRANARAADAANALKIYSEQLGKYADATPEAMEAADARVVALELLLVEVDELVPRAVSAATAAATARDEETQARELAGLLSSIAVPDGVGELQDAAAEARRLAEDARRAAEDAANTADDARQAAAAGPRRGDLERARDHHAEVSRHNERRPGIVDAETDAASRLEAATASHRGLADSAAEAQALLATRAVELAQATTLQTDLDAQREALLGVGVPEGLDEMLRSAKVLSKGAEDARAGVPEAERRVVTLEEAFAAAGSQETVTRAREELDAWANTAAQLTATRVEHETGTRLVEALRADARAAVETLTAAENDRDRARLLVGAAQLRPTLHVGEPCPVCRQQVSVLPPLSDDADADAADAAVQLARAARHMAERAAAEAETRLRDTATKVATLEDRQSATDLRLLRLLPDRHSGEQRDVDGDVAFVAELEAQLATAATAREEARRELREARDLETSTRRASDAAERRLDGARADLHTALGRLSAYDPPPVDPAELEAAWSQLHTWAADRLKALDRQLDDAWAASSHATREHAEQRELVTRLEGERDTAQAALTAAASAASRATQSRVALDDRLTELSGLLAEAPTADEVEPLLEECARLEAALDAAAGEATKARNLAATRSEAWQGWQTRTAAAASELTTARDAVLGLSPPPVATDDLVAGWQVLVTWAEGQGADLTARAAALVMDAEGHQAEHSRLTEQVVRRTRELEVEVPNDETTQASRAVAVALQKSRDQVEAIAEDIAEAADLTRKVEAQRETQSVAGMLAGLLRSNRFPRWLAEAALDSLVAGASQSLHELSGGQFDLSHKDGEFVVIDHADADLTRSVKTLSGGETFQASLALALALSNHLAGMGGSTKLESIFLDEGFGTLDRDALDAVAATLENLSQGERVVGVITHVADLAERAPVRFRVHRDSRTSHIEREDG